MSSYRFCRTDDIALLAEAYNRCWLPHVPGDPPMAAAEIKTEIRDLQLWCSSSMVAFEGDDPIGFLHGAKRPSGTLVHRIAVHPDHLRKEHGRHLLTSLSSKLAILGPPRIVAEVPEDLAPACALFDGCGYAREAVLTDHVLDPTAHSPGRSGTAPDDTFLVPITVDDLLANQMLGGESRGRSSETLIARKDGIEGLALATVNSIAAFLLYRKLGGDAGTEIQALRALDDEDAEAAAGSLLDAVVRRTPKPLSFPRVHPDEIPREWLETWGFEPRLGHVRFGTLARSA